MGSVNLKGTGSGIILDLDPNVSFEELSRDLTSKFRESSSFLGRASVGLLIRGRVLNDDEEAQVLAIIGDNSRLTITCVLKEDPRTDEIFAGYAREEHTSFADMPDSTDDTPDFNLDDLLEPLPARDNAKIYRGSLRSGQTLTFKESVIIMGDIKPGANVTSDGNIFVLGSLRGCAYAGAQGDEKAYVFALELDPLQVRIANAIAISPDADNGPKLKQRKFRKKPTEKVPEVAYILNGHVVKDVYGPAFMRDNK